MSKSNQFLMARIKEEKCSFRTIKLIVIVIASLLYLKPKVKLKFTTKLEKHRTKRGIHKSMGVMENLIFPVGPFLCLN